MGDNIYLMCSPGMFQYRMCTVINAVQYKRLLKAVKQLLIVRLC